MMKTTGACPNDTDSDGGCGRPLCPHCGPHRPVLDANGTPVTPIPDSIVPDDVFRAFMAGRVPAKDCPHYIAQSEARAGFTRCERCP